MDTRAGTPHEGARFMACPHGDRCWHYLRIATGIAAWQSWQQLWNSIPDDNDDLTWH